MFVCGISACILLFLFAVVPLLFLFWQRSAPSKEQQKSVVAKIRKNNGAKTTERIWQWNQTEKYIYNIIYIYLFIYLFNEQHQVHPWEHQIEAIDRLQLVVQLQTVIRLRSLRKLTPPRKPKHTVVSGSIRHTRPQYGTSPWSKHFRQWVRAAEGKNE